MTSPSSFLSSTGVGIVCAAVALASALLSPTTATAQLDKEARKEARCRAKVTKSLQQLGSRHFFARGICADQQAAGSINPTVDCMAEPLALGGPGIGAPNIEKRFERIVRKVRRDSVRIGSSCSSPTRNPQSMGFDQLCPNPADAANDWTKMLECGYDLVRASGDRLEGLVYRVTVDSAQDQACRLALGASMRATLRGRMKMRNACFGKRDRGEQGLNCMATSAWPGKTLPTGLDRTDRELREQMMGLRISAHAFCSFDLATSGFTSHPDINDPTASSPNGGAFTDEDLFHELADALIMESTRIAAAMYPGFSYCGDGIADPAFGEECDDGVDNLSSCDGCDRDCTLQACNNGSACGSSEVCDDGNTTLGDGCDVDCLFESCGDGIVQPGLGETCDDGNVIDCDGCDSTCTPSDVCSNGITCESTGEECDLGLGVCVAGIKELEVCVDASDCTACVAGPLFGESCTTNTDCGANGAGEEFLCQTPTCGGFCVGGADDSKLCVEDLDCPGACKALLGAGQACQINEDCFPGLRCNGSGSCVHPRANRACQLDEQCGENGGCVLSDGCMAGNSDVRPDTCRDNCLAPWCGDGTVDGLTDTNGFGGETCDDTNFVDGDGCDSNCTLTGCGNGIRTEGEECDLGPGICLLGFDDGLICQQQADCRGKCFELQDRACTEEDAALVCEGFSCLAALGCFGGNVDGVGCRSDCTIPRCGDGRIDVALGEECDDGPGVCLGGFDDQEDCLQGQPVDCRGICTTGPNTGVACFLDSECEIGGCSLGTCIGGTGDPAVSDCSTTCTSIVVP